MHELTRTNAPVLLSWLVQALTHVGVEAIASGISTEFEE